MTEESLTVRVWGLHRRPAGLALLDPGISGSVNSYLSSLQ